MIACDVSPLVMFTVIKELENSIVEVFQAYLSINHIIFQQIFFILTGSEVMLFDLVCLMFILPPANTSEANVPRLKHNDQEMIVFRLFSATKERKAKSTQRLEPVNTE